MQPELMLFMSSQEYTRKDNMNLSLIFLNTYNARFKERLFDFIEQNDPDIFCFQEIYSGLEPEVTSTGSVVDQYYQMRILLQDRYFGYHHVRQEDWPDSTYKKSNPWGNAIFVKKGIKIISYFEEYILGYRNSADKNNLSKTLPVGAQSISVEIQNNIISVTNFHGYYAGVGVGKEDSIERILQSENLLNHVNKLPGIKILGGDFNLNPNTESIKILENASFENLIKKYNIKTTRTEKYPKEKRDIYPYADYVFTEKGLNVQKFYVDETFEGSDHAPMFLNISI